MAEIPDDLASALAAHLAGGGETPVVIVQEAPSAEAVEASSDAIVEQIEAASDAAVAEIEAHAAADVAVIGAQAEAVETVTESEPSGLSPESDQVVDTAPDGGGDGGLLDQLDGEPDAPPMPSHWYTRPWRFGR